MSDPVAPDGLVDPAWWRQRQDAYLDVAVRSFEPSHPLSVIEHLEFRRRNPDHELDWSAVGDDELAAWFDRIDNWLDCGDFDILRLLHLWWGYGDLLPERIRDAISSRVLAFSYWYTDPVPEGVVDQRWYWSENHRLIFHACEYLAGEAFADATFTSDGVSGADHARRGARMLAEWFDDKARWGFSEWHSDVYYSKDLAPLLILAEHAPDPAVSERASVFLDLLLLDIALHSHRGNMGVTHGRSYMKDKSRAVDQPVFAGAKLCFDTTSEPWRPPETGAGLLLPRNESATLLASAQRYRLPEAIRQVAISEVAYIDRERMSVPIDPYEPLSDSPRRDDGLSYDDPEMVPFWWDRSALTPWQLVGVTMDTLDRYDLWEADLFAAARGLREVTGGDRDVARQLAHDLAPQLSGPLLAEVDTICYRSRHVMLSAAQSYRPGNAGFQHHIWQATLDENAVVFTTHPGNEPRGEVAESVDTDRYWTGTATLPRVVQVGRAAICRYRPAYESPTQPELEIFSYLPYTHAWFPTAAFDEVRREGHWTFGRRGGAFVGLYSARPVRWRPHGEGPEFDLVADGGADNTWIVEVGDTDDWVSFDEFTEALSASRIEVGEEVVYDSPAEGELRCGWTGPVVVEGAEVAVGGHPRIANPFVAAEAGEPLTVTAGGSWLHLDLVAGIRAAG